MAAALHSSQYGSSPCCQSYSFFSAIIAVPSPIHGPCLQVDHYALPSLAPMPPPVNTIRLIEPRQVATVSCRPFKVLQTWHRVMNRFTSTWANHAHVRKVCPESNRPIFANVDHSELWARYENFGRFYASLKKPIDGKTVCQIEEDFLVPAAEDAYFRSYALKPWIIGYTHIATGVSRYYKPENNTLRHLQKPPIDKNN